MPYQTKEDFSDSLTKSDILAAIAKAQPNDWQDARNCTKADLIRIARRETLEIAYKQKTIMKMMR